METRDQLRGEGAAPEAPPPPFFSTGLDEKLRSLRHWFGEQRRVAVALSGGVDSGLLLALASESLGSAALGVTGISPSLSEDEGSMAREVAAFLRVPLIEIETQEMEIAGYRANSGDRCYHCKTELYSRISASRDSRLDGATLVDGTHAEDFTGDRPGMLAATEQGVVSPLRAFGFTKEEIRKLARERDLPNCDRPARPCLASRIPVGTEVDRELLSKVEVLEALLAGEGFLVFRARLDRERVLIELGKEELVRRGESGWRRRLLAVATRLGYQRVELDLRAYGVTGSSDPIPILP